jgi:hypothetical protein
VTTVGLLEYGTPVMCLVTLFVWAQKRAWRRPPRTPREAAMRAALVRAPVLSQFGVRITRDRFVYGAGGRNLGPLDGATASVERAVPAGSVRVRTRGGPARTVPVRAHTGWAVIEFADGTTRRHPFGLRNEMEARAQAAQFNTLAAWMPSGGGFRRTRPPQGVTTP